MRNEKKGDVCMLAMAWLGTYMQVVERSRGIYVLESHNLLNTDADFANTPYFTF